MGSNKTSFFSNWRYATRKKKKKKKTKKPRPQNRGEHNPDHAKSYERAGVFPLDEVLPYVHFGSGKGVDPSTDPPFERIYICNGVKHLVKMGSKRYRLFATKGIKCVKCGIEGKFFALERQRSFNENELLYHFNLYAVDKYEKEILMTKDHIVPQAKRGSNSYKNLQPMCEFCNHEKSDKLEK